MNQQGFVSLVGAGPGSVDLMTVKSLRLIQQADVVVYDRLVSQEILALIPAKVTRVPVGKEVGKHCVPQEKINQTIIDLANSGRHIVRLKGGDPYTFGRGGEEAIALKKQQIPFEVVPGITAASGCSAYSGIPLTHRGMSHSVRFVTGHWKNDEPMDINWKSLADPDCTLVIYMGLSNLSQICHALIDAGLSPLTPAAAIENGTTHDQQRVLSPLKQLDYAVKQSNLIAPVMIIIGKVVSLADEIDWFQYALDESRHQEVVRAQA